MPVTIEIILEAFRNLGGQGSLLQITEQVKKNSTSSLPRNYRAIIRREIQQHSSDSKSKPKKEDLFASVYGVEKRKGIWKIRAPSPHNPPPQNNELDKQDEAADYTEGNKQLKQHLEIERSSRLIQNFKNSLQNFKCECCDFDFEETYGPLGKGFIEAHHKIPLSQLSHEKETSIRDLAALCSNCHRMVHKGKSMTVEHLRSIIKNK